MFTRVPLLGGKPGSEKRAPASGWEEEMKMESKDFKMKAFQLTEVSSLPFIFKINLYLLAAFINGGTSCKKNQISGLLRKRKPTAGHTEPPSHVAAVG